MEIKKNNFIPANIIGVTENMRNLSFVDKYKKEYKFSWWESNSFFYYPYILISAFYGLKHKDIRKKYNIPKNVCIIGDSGGFQNQMFGGTVNPLKVLEWQENNCDIGFIFDNPINVGNDKKTILQKQITTVENGVLALKNKTNSNLKLYGVIQGYSYEDQKQIINLYQKTNTFEQYDGFCLGGIVPLSQNLNEITQIITIFCECFKHYKKPLHILGVSGTKTMAIMNYLQALYNFEVFTYDSSSYGGGAIRLEFINLFDKFKISIGNNSQNILKKIPCICPVCIKISNIDILRNGGSIPGGLLALHNLYQYIQFSHFLFSLKDDINLLKNYMISFLGIQKELIDFIDMSFKQNYQQSYSKYSYLFKQPQTGKQMAINF